MLTRLRDRFAQGEPWQRTLWIVFFAQVCTAIGFSMIFPFLPLYVESLGTNTDIGLEFWAGMVFSAQALTMMIASPVWGAIADRYGRKLMLERAMFGGMIVIALMAFVRTAEELVLIRAIQGLITGTVAAANALVASVAPRERTGYAMGVVQVALWSGVALGPVIGGVLADAFGYRVPFLITAGLLGSAGVLIHIGVQENFQRTPQTDAEGKSYGFLGGWKHVLGMRGVMQTYAIRFMAGLSRTMLIPIMPLFVVLLLTENAVLLVPDNFASVAAVLAGVSTITGLVVGARSAASTFSAVYLGRLGDRIGHRKIVIWCSLAAALLAVPVAFVTATWQLLALTFLSGLAVGGLVAAPSALLARYTDPGEEGAVYGLDNSVMAGARALAPLVGAGIAALFGLRVAFLASAGLFGLMLVVAVLLLPDDPLVEPDAPAQSFDLQPAASAK
jgi:MFS transporter, DHA1 family, multidrug resistance protein